MSDRKISDLSDGGAVQSTDEFVAARAGANVKIAGSAIGSGGGSVPFVGATAPSSPTDGELWWDTDDNTAIAMTPTTATVTVATDGTFRASHVFDLGEGPHLVDVNFVLVSLDADGEPTGTGGIGVIDASATDGPGWATSRDNVSYLQAASSLAGVGDVDDVSGMMVTPGENVSVVLTTLRYLRLSISIQTTGDFTTYAGSNDPVASVRLDLVYR